MSNKKRRKRRGHRPFEAAIIEKSPRSIRDLGKRKTDGCWRGDSGEVTIKIVI